MKKWVGSAIRKFARSSSRPPGKIGTTPPVGESYRIIDELFRSGQRILTGHVTRRIQEGLEKIARGEVALLLEGSNGRTIQTTEVQPHGIVVVHTNAFNYYLMQALNGATQAYRDTTQGSYFTRSLTHEEMRSFREMAQPFVMALERPDKKDAETGNSIFYKMLMTYVAMHPSTTRILRSGLDSNLFRTVQLYPVVPEVRALEKMRIEDAKKYLGNLPHIHVSLTCPELQQAQSSTSQLVKNYIK